MTDIMGLYQLVYQSKAAYPFDDQALAELLAKVRPFNTEYNITGILLYGYGSFLQMLEGDDDVVRSLYYLKIARDPRHTNLKVLKEGYSSTRLFQQWAMAFRPLEPNLFTHISGFVNPDQESEYGRDLLNPLRTMEALELLSLDVERRGA
jgi:Sensors of blue-light using FAD